MMPIHDYDPYITIKEAAKILNLTHQAVFYAMKKGKIIGTKHFGPWKVQLSSVKEYPSIRYATSHRLFNGIPIYDTSKGRFSVSQLAKILKIHPQKIYYLLRKDSLPSERIGKAYVVLCKDPKEFFKAYLQKKTRLRKCQQLELNLN